MSSLDVFCSVVVVIPLLTVTVVLALCLLIIAVACAVRYTRKYCCFCRAPREGSFTPSPSLTAQRNATTGRNQRHPREHWKPGELHSPTLRLLNFADIQGGPKNLTPSVCTPQFHQILTDLQTYFTVWISRTFVIMLSLKIPPHLKCVAKLVKCQCLKSYNWKQDDFCNNTF